VRPELAASATNALALSDALEALIADAKATDEDREAAYELVQKLPADTAGDAFGRAAITGRYAESKGAFAIVTTESPLSLVGEAEKFAVLSRRLDPEFRKGAATRMLGTLYVLAPANLLDGGDSEEGLTLLEDLTKAHPEDPNNQLRLAEAYIALGDKEPAGGPLCAAQGKRAELRRDDTVLLDRLIHDFGALECKAPAPPPPPAPPVD
jgi:tetratricopeptide (TPR) repeat protein